MKQRLQQRVEIARGALVLQPDETSRHLAVVSGRGRRLNTLQVASPCSSLSAHLLQSTWRVTCTSTLTESVSFTSKPRFGSHNSATCTKLLKPLHLEVSAFRFVHHECPIPVGLRRDEAVA